MFAVLRTPALGADLTSVLCNGEWLTLGLTVDAISGLTLTIDSGEIFGLVGPNGAGKTTTLKMLSTLLPPTAGDAFIGGVSIRKDPDAVRRVTKIETATEPRFQELFVAAMAFPHATAPTPYLAGDVALPARAAERGTRRRSRTRGRSHD